MAVTRKKTVSETSPQRFSYTPILMILLIVGAFFLGSYVTKTQYLEKMAATPTQTGTGQAAPPAITNDQIKTWAKEIGVNTNNFNKCFDQNVHQDLITKDQTDGSTVGVNGTPSFFINDVLLVGAQPYETFKTEIDNAIAGTQTGEKVTVDTGHLPMLGKADAPVTMVEFSDFECPFCHRFIKETFPQLKKDYIDTGKVVLYYRHYPLAFHPLAKPFANASECANAQGKFWLMHDKIFKEQG